MGNKNKLELNPKPKQPVQVNRPLVITVTIIILTVLLLAIISAFNSTKTVKTTTPTIKVSTEKAEGISPELQRLPGSYSDVEGIKRYLPESPNHELASLMQQFDELKSAYALLRQELAAKGRPAPEKALEDPKTQAAKASNIVFAGMSSNAESLVGGGGEGGERQSRFGAPSSSTQTSGLIPTPEQEKLFKKQAEDTQKLAVMKAKDSPEDIYDLHNPIKPYSKYQIQAGTLIPATLITGINSSVPGSVVAQIRQNIYDTVSGKYLLIPKGSKLLGEYANYGSSVSAGQSRVALGFTRIIRPDGSSILLGKPYGADLGGHSGVEANVNNHWGQVLGYATISAILGFGAGVASDRFSNNSNQTTSRQSGFLGIGQAFSGIGQALTGRAVNIPPTLTLPSGHQFMVVVRRDIVLNPYNPRA